MIVEKVAEEVSGTEDLRPLVFSRRRKMFSERRSLEGEGLGLDEPGVLDAPSRLECGLGKWPPPKPYMLDRSANDLE